MRHKNNGGGGGIKPKKTKKYTKNKNKTTIRLSPHHLSLAHHNNIPHLWPTNTKKDVGDKLNANYNTIKGCVEFRQLGKGQKSQERSTQRGDQDGLVLSLGLGTVGTGGKKVWEKSFLGQVANGIGSDQQHNIQIRQERQRATNN